MRNTTTAAPIGMLALGAASGCAMQQEQNLNALQDPKRINYGTADCDLRTLQSEKANVAQRIAEGATGDYDAQIDGRIAEVQETCGIR